MLKKEAINDKTHHNTSEDDEDKGEETFGGNGHFGRDPSKIREQSVYADPRPTPAPKATAAHLVVGLLNKRRAEPAPATEE